MFDAGKTLATRAVMERLVLLVNHVIAAEPVAAGRLRAHVDKRIGFSFEGWPSLLPALPAATFRVTPAGLFEWQADALGAEEELLVAIDTSNPARVAFRLFTGDRPAITVSGDAAFAADVNWLFDNLRWDIEDDLARLIGDAPARELGRLGGAVNQALRKAAATLRGFGAPRPFGAGEPPAQ
jgi:ubiquinone biosynthesis protein UbiJ